MQEARTLAESFAAWVVLERVRMRRPNVTPEERAAKAVGKMAKEGACGCGAWEVILEDEIRQAVAEERERCAKVAEDWPEYDSRYIAPRIADKIRRGDQP